MTQRANHVMNSLSVSLVLGLNLAVFYTLVRIGRWALVLFMAGTLIWLLLLMRAAYRRHGSAPDQTDAGGEHTQIQRDAA